MHLHNYIIFAKLPRYEMYLTLFYFWTSLASLDVSSSNEVTDFGIQNLIFPPTIISSRGSLNNGVKVNLTNTRARTSNVAKVLQVSKRLVWARWSEKLGFSCIVPEISYIHFCNPKVIDSRKTQVTVIGCVIMLQFAPRLTKPQGHLYHESIGDAIEMLNVKLKVKHIGVTGNMVLKFIMKCILKHRCRHLVFRLKASFSS